MTYSFLFLFVAEASEAFAFNTFSGGDKPGSLRRSLAAECAGVVWYTLATNVHASDRDFLRE